MKSRFLLATAFVAGSLGSTTPISAQTKPIALSRGEVQKAAQQHPQIVEEFGGTVDAKLGDYVRGVGQRVAGQTGVQGGAQSYTITTLNSPVLNAFAVPGGYVYVTRQLLAIMNDEAELASVIGHEMGHVAAKHGQKRNTTSQLGSLGAGLLGAFTGSELVGQLAGQVAQTYILSYSRSQENEADKLGLRYISGASYDPFATPRLLGTLGASTDLDDRINGRDQRSVPSWTRSHPLSADRVRKTEALAQAVPAGGARETDRDRYLAAIEGMVYDDDPRQGVIDGQNFLHPRLGLKFTAPTGFGIQNGASEVTVSGNAGQAQFSGGTASNNLDAYIGQVYRELAGGQRQIEYRSHQTTVNGIPAAYSTVTAQTQKGQVDVSVFAYQWDASRTYHFLTMTQAGSGLGPFQSMVGSVTKLSQSETAAIKPRVIHVITVQAGDTVQKLADQMAYRDYKLERFLTLNALKSDSQLMPGDKVKLVVYAQ
jgi:predicted Zn-dependent protease